MSGKLFIVPTPVGNLNDMTPRAVQVLRDVALILAEDTRTSAPLLKYFEIATPMASHHKYNEHSMVQKIVDQLLAGQDVALISDAGTPGVSDPGFMLSRACREAQVAVETLPGPTAFVPALVDSGLPCDRFIFQGFLPVKKGRQTRIAEIADSAVTSIVYESPVRLLKTITALKEACGPDRAASVSREISKKFEETIRGTLEEIESHFAANPPRGEFVVIVAPKEENLKRTHKNKYINTDDDE